MEFDKRLIAGKLRRWEKYLDNYRLPQWEDIPDIGLYMEQVIVLLKEYLDYFPPELKEEQFITAATINNYVRKRIMPEPVKKKYYRSHIAYLIIICSLKQCLSLATIQTMLPLGLSDDEAAVLDAFKKREAMGTTGMQSGFAIPHCKSEAVKDAAVYVVKFAGDIAWDSMDGEPIKVALALFAPDGDVHLTLLMMVAGAINSEAFCNKILESNDPEVIAATLNDNLIG